MQNINLNLLRTLQVLLEESHVSRTAERLCVTQSAVSRQLTQLRELFGDPLLIREATACCRRLRHSSSRVRSIRSSLVARGCWMSQISPRSIGPDR